MMKDIRTAFRSIFFNGVTNNLTFACASTGPIVIADPAPVEIPGHLQSDLRISEMYVGKRQSRDIIKKVSVRSQPNLTRVSTGRHNVLFRHGHWPTFLDCEGIALLDSAQEVFADHPLHSRPIVWTDSIAGL